MGTDLSLTALGLIACYRYRFKIEVAFKQALHTLGTYAYHFCKMTMTPISRNSGNRISIAKPNIIAIMYAANSPSIIDTSSSAASVFVRCPRLQLAA
jgi:hypothetical protein